MNKRIRLTLCMTTLALSLSGCKEETNPDVQLYSEGLKIIETIDAMAESSEYVQQLSTNDEITAEINTIGQQDYTTTDKVYKISAVIFENDDTQNLSEELKENLYIRTLSSVPNQINSALGVKTLAATSAVTSSKSFICEGIAEPCIYLYTFNSNYSGAVAFIPYEDNVVSAAGSLIASKALLDLSSADAVRETLISNTNIEDCTVEEITLS